MGREERKRKLNTNTYQDSNYKSTKYYQFEGIYIQFRLFYS